MMVGSGWRVAWLWLLFAGTPACARAQTFEEAAALHQAGKLADAERAYRAVIRRGGAGAEVWANLGALLARQDRFDEAVEAYRKALEMAPQLAKVRLNLGLAYFKADRFEPAGQEFSAYLAADPGNRQALQLRAMCALEMEKFEDAVAGYLALMPTADLTIRLGLATAYTRLGKTDAARAALGPAVSREDSAEVQFLLGQALAEDGRLDEALAAFEKALRLNPRLPQLRLHIGSVYWKKKDVESALDAWRAELQEHPASFAPNYTLGAALSLPADHRDEAEKYLRAALQQKPSHAGAQYHLGKLLWQRSKSAEAVGWLERAANAVGAPREAHYLLATVYQSLGRKADAAREFAVVKTMSEKEIQRSRDLFEADR